MAVFKSFVGNLVHLHVRSRLVQQYPYEYCSLSRLIFYIHNVNGASSIAVLPTWYFLLPSLPNVMEEG